MDTGEWIVIGLSILIGAWFVAGAIYNRRLGLVIYQWLFDGLLNTGKISEKSWIGSSGTGARLVVGQAKTPFRRIEVNFILESREILPIWLFNRVSNKQDELILKADLDNTPSREIEVAHPGDRQLKELLKKDRWIIEKLPPSEHLWVASLGQMSDEEQMRLISFLEQYHLAMHRISLRSKKPHLMIRAYLQPLKVHSAKDFFIAIEQLVKM